MSTIRARFDRLRALLNGKAGQVAITLSFEQPAARRPMGDFRALVETGAYRALSQANG